MIKYKREKYFLIYFNVFKYFNYDIIKYNVDKINIFYFYSPKNLPKILLRKIFWTIFQ
jgi:hypothetical protein